jgi:DNA repair protein RadC
MSDLKNVHWLEIVRVQKTRVSKINSGQDVCDILWPMVQKLDRENTFIIALDNGNNIIGVHQSAIGTDVVTHFDPRTTFRFLLLSGALSYVMVHNHPNTDPADPSKQDVTASTMISNIGREMFCLQMKDSIVISSTGKWCSVMDTKLRGEVGDDIREDNLVAPSDNAIGYTDNFDDYEKEANDKLDREMQEMMDELKEW